MEGRGLEVDVVVIGAGVNGAGVARDCALRGLSVAVFEKNDVGFGASGNSSGMIHGGPRYLTKAPGVTESSCLDSGIIQRTAPYMLFRVPFLVPVFDTGLSAAAQLAAYDAFFDVYDRYQELKRGKPHLRYSAAEVRQLEPGLAPTAGAVSFDEWGVDGVRLCVGNLRDAAIHGAHIFNHTCVTDVERTPEGRVTGVRAFRASSGETFGVRARVVVNATGAWAPLTSKRAGLSPSALRLRPGKGVHVYLDRRLTNFAVVTQAVDGRQVFLLPWQNMSVLGTTDDDYSGDLDRVVATTQEVRYLRQAISRVLPAVQHARAIGTWAGVRPTLFAWGKHEDALSREHEILDHGRDGLRGFWSMVGGKLASYRLFSQEMADVVAHQLRWSVASSTHSRPLPGGERQWSRPTLARRALAAGVDPLSMARLYARHGTWADRVLDGPAEHSRTVCACEPVTEAEIRYTIRYEWARSVDDVARRTRLGLGSCGGMRCAAECGRIVAEERGASPRLGRESAARFLSGAMRRRLPAVGPEQARQEVLAWAHARAQLGVDVAEDSS